MKTWIIGHFGSCNMGDKYQPYVIANALISKTSTYGSWDNLQNMILINYSGTENNTEMSISINKKKHIVYPLDFIMESDSRSDLTILTTGSMDGNSPYISNIKKILERKLTSKLIIWGGFSRGNDVFETFAKPLAFLKNDIVFYLARSYRDFEIFKQITNNKDNVMLSGDPMCWWSSDEGKIFGRSIGRENTPDILSKKLIVIPSVYGFRHNKKFWTDLCEKADFIVCIDTFADKDIVQTYKNKAFDTSKPWTLSEILNQCSHVVSSRLHGSIISSMLRVPTTMIITDSADAGKGSFKFEAVCGNSYMINTPLCDVVKCNEAQSVAEGIPIVQNEHIDEYIRLTNRGLDFIIQQTSK